MGEDLEAFGGEETIIIIYYILNSIFNKKERIWVSQYDWSDRETPYHAVILFMVSFNFKTYTNSSLNMLYQLIILIQHY